jgi:Amt family ammonium transporter
VNTTLCPSAAAITCIFFGRYVDQSKSYNISDALNGILAGLVSITGCCATVEPWHAIIIGGFALLY